MLAKNILILSLVHVIRLILPLLIIPLLTRRIDAGEFGIYMYTISFAAWLSIFIEYGFNISSTREVASSARGEEIWRIVKGTQSAKVLLSTMALPLLLIAAIFIPVFQGHFYWACAAWVLGFLSALSPIYYYQGKEKLRMVGITEAGSGLLTLVAVYFLINSTADFYRLPLIMAIARLISFAVLTAGMYREIGTQSGQLFDFQDGWRALRTGFDIFVFQGAVSFYTSFNVVFLGFFCSPIQVGAYAAAERLMRAGLGFITQFSNAIFPRLNSLRMDQNLKMEQMRKAVLGGFLVIGLLGMLVTWWAAPVIALYLFPASHTEVNEIVRILALLIPAIALSNVLGFQYLLVDRKERLFNRIIGFAAVLNIVLAYCLVNVWQVRGMAFSWVAVEWVVTLLLAISVFLLSKNKKGQPAQS